MVRSDHVVQVFRPALLPDNRRLVWYPLTICGILALAGYILNTILLLIIPLIVAALFPGMPIAIHSVFFLSVKITLQGDTLTVVDWASDPFVSFPRRQETALSQIAYVYHLQKEAEAYKAETTPPPPFCNTRLKSKKYFTADRDPRRAGSVARTNNGLVLSDRNGVKKVYIMHFHDLSKKDWQRLASQFLERNRDISFLMSDREKNGLLGSRL